MKNKITYSGLLILCLIFLVFCKKKKDNISEDIIDDSFDKKALLVNLSDNAILPAYQNFKTDFDSLLSINTSFQSSNSFDDFKLFQNQFKRVYLKYQTIDLFEFGPAETSLIRANCNTFPTDTTQINLNVSSGNYDLSLVSNIDAKGFPAIEFLLFGNNISDVAAFNSLISSNSKKLYLSNILSDISSKINPVILEWNNSYKNTFINSLGSDVGSSIGYLVNQLNYQLDYLKNAKIGIPLGKKSLGVAMPGNCEAFYTNESLQLAKETLYAIETLYLGRSQSGSNGMGFDDYLAHLKANYNGGLLSDAIANQFNLAKTKLNAIPNPLSQQVTSNPTIVDEAYVELVKLLVLLKTDMPSNLGVIITYQDGDGD